MPPVIPNATPVAANQSAPLPTCELLGMSLAQIGQDQLLDHMFGALAHKQGGWLITANLDFLYRYARDVEARALYDAADIRVADGMPLVWAARLQGDHLPERVAGSSMVAGDRRPRGGTESHPLLAGRSARRQRAGRDRALRAVSRPESLWDLQPATVRSAQRPKSWRPSSTS